MNDEAVPTYYAIIDQMTLGKQAIRAAGALDVL